MNHLILRIAIICLVLPVGGFGQPSKTADKLYNELGFKLAIPEYEKLEQFSLGDLVRIANAYRLNGDTENAEIWYSQVVQTSNDALHFLYYAQALQSNGKLEDARRYYLIYHEMLGGDASDQRGQLLAEAIDRIGEFKHEGVEVVNEVVLNSARLDFSPAYTKNGIVFVSSRGLGKGPETFKDKWLNDNFMALFFSEKSEKGELGRPEPFSLRLTSKYHDGPVVFSNNDNKVFCTRNQFRKGKRKNSSQGIMKQDIYMSYRDGQNWSEPEVLPFNSVEFEEVHPAISPDGHVLYFASDRPGGYGEMDLYQVTMRGGQWSDPVNLGPEINTAGNELFPFVHDDGTLYFASDGWGGLGGLDIFSSYVVNDSFWVKAHNIGAPFNSPKDDFGFILNPTGTEGYFTSSRDGGQGMDDIYSFKIGRPVAMKARVLSKICVQDERDTQRLINAKVRVEEIVEINEKGEGPDEDFVMRLVETEKRNEYILKLKKEADTYSGEVVPTYTTDENGEFWVELKPGRKYRFTAEKEGYKLTEKIMETGELEQIEFCIPMAVSHCIVLNGETNNGKFAGKKVANATVTMVNLCTGEEHSVRSAPDGVFRFPCLECGCEYILKGEKTNFKAGVADVSTLDTDCSKGGTMDVEIRLTPADRDELLFAGKKLEAGATAELKNIFYDFDQFYIRSDARPDLDRVVALMKDYPSLIIELGSHTDSRGTASYNQQLSQKRAEAAVQYIVERGVDSRRLIARGYGESQPRNHCRDGVKCTEAEHQYNRRTEIKIISNDEKDLKVKYIDNRPAYIDEAGRQ